MDSDIAKGRH